MGSAAKHDTVQHARDGKIIYCYIQDFVPLKSTPVPSVLYRTVAKHWVWNRRLIVHWDPIEERFLITMDQ